MATWTIEESVEDALAAYLAGVLPGEVKVVKAYEVESAEYPCVVIAMETGENVAPDAGFTGHRILNGEILILVEALPQKDDDGTTLKTPRERNKDIRQAVLNVFAVTGLVEQLNSVGGHGVTFSSVQMMDSERDIQDRIFLTSIKLEVIAQPTAES